MSTLKQKIDAFELVPSDGGCFELTVNGKQIFSKMQTGQFPNEDEIVKAVSKLAG